jgi:glycosyltransferase involved in cell wall biosynthesis
MRILLISSKFPPEYSGSGYRAWNTYRRLENKYPIKWDIISNSSNTNGNCIYEFEGKSIYRISSPLSRPYVRRWPNQKRFFSLRAYFIHVFDTVWHLYYSWKYVRGGIDKYDALHTFGESWTIGFITYFFSRANKVIVREVVNDITTPYFPKHLSLVMRKIFSNESSMVVAISEKVETMIAQYDVKNTWQRPNPVDEKRFLINFKSKYELREKLSKFREDDIVITHIALFIKRKNHKFLLDVMLGLPKNYKLLIGGPVKPENEEIFTQVADRIRELGLEDRVQLNKGFVENIEEYITLSDVFLFPVYKEGFGTPMIEAQACGVPVVATRIEGVTTSYISEGKGGYLSELNPKMFSEKIQLAVQIPRKTLEKNRKIVLSTTSTEVIDKSYYNKIKGLININEKNNSSHLT